MSKSRIILLAATVLVAIAVLEVVVVTTKPKRSGIRAEVAGTSVTADTTPPPAPAPIPSTPDTAAPTVPTEPTTTTTLPVRPRYTTTTTEPEAETETPTTPDAIGDDVEIWVAIGRCEQPGNGWRGVNWSHHGNGADGGYQGGLGFYFGTWDAYKGGTSAANIANAGDATPMQQIEVARNVRAAHGYGAWGCGRKLGYA